MSDSMLGMVPEQVKDLAADLKQKSNQLDSLQSCVTGKLGQVTWEGNDAKAFRNKWKAHAATIRNISNAMNAFGQAAQNQAEEQEQTSNA